MSDKIQIVKLQVKAGDANPGTVGSDLGQYGVNLRDFCTQFNDESLSREEKGTLMPVKLVINKKDRSFKMSISAPPVAQLIIKAIGCKGSGEPNKNKVGKLSHLDVMAIVDKKRAELTGVTEQAMINTVAGTARSMGVEVEMKEQKDDQ
jgi:large subunit ribosomal protein L11